MCSLTSGLIAGLSLLSPLLPSSLLSQERVDGPTGSTDSSFLYRNFCDAKKALETAVEAHGGQEWVDGLINFRALTSAELFYQAHYERPWKHHIYTIKGELLYSGERGAFKRVEKYNYNRPLNSFTVLDGSRGMQLAAGSETVEDLEGDELAAQWAEQMELFPQEYLRQASAHPGSLRLLGSDGTSVVLQYQPEGENPRALFIDSNTHLLQRVEHLGHWKSKGDRLEWTNFNQYSDIDGIQVATTIDNHREGESTQSDTLLHLTQVEIGTAIEDSEFGIAPFLRRSHPDFQLTPPEEPAIDLLKSHDLGKGVYIIDVPEMDARSMLVEFADFTVIIEGGEHSAISEKIIDTAEALCPEKPLRFLAMSHHHPFYTGGVRAYVSRDVTLLCTPGNVEYLRDLATRPYRIHPDAQGRRPREPIFQTIDKRMVIEDHTQRLEFHSFDSSSHTDEYILTYLPGLQLGFLGDLVYSPKEGETQAARGRTQAVYDLVTQLGLDIRQLSQTWFLKEGKMLYPYSEIEESVRLAKEAK